VERNEEREQLRDAVVEAASAFCKATKAYEEAIICSRLVHECAKSYHVTYRQLCSDLDVLNAHERKVGAT